MFFMETFQKSILRKSSYMKLKLTLLLMSLLGVGLFAQGQNKPSKPPKADKVEVVDGRDALPVTVKSNKKSKVRKPPPPPPVEAPPIVIRKPEQPAPPPPPEKMKIKINKHIPPPPPPPAKPRPAVKSVPSDTPEAPDRV
jgi:outer membrane biosynthesis protein TonB